MECPLWRISRERELYHRLWDEPMFRYICDIEDREKPYHSSQITRFRSNVGPERLDGIGDELVEGGVIDGETVAMDATFISAWSRRHLHNNRWRYSDPDARVDRDGRTYDLGHKAHIAADVHSDLPLAFIVASANEKKHAAGLLDKTVEETGGRVERLVTDSQYSRQRFKEKVADCGGIAVIPYPPNQSGERKCCG